MTTYAPHTSTEAIARAQGWVGKSYPAGWCQRWVVAEIFGTGGVGDWDGDGAADAEDGWKAAQAKVPVSQITSLDRVPPGVACYWSGGAHDNGHAAVSAGNGWLYSTDLPYMGRVGKVPITEPHTRWGLTFLGYATVMNGYTLTDPPVVAPSPGAVTTFDVCNWNVASPRWFTPWAPRAAGISAEIAGEASVYGFQEVYDETQAATIGSALGSDFSRVAGRAGLEFWFDKTKWMVERPIHEGGYASGVQGRYALVVHLRRRSTGQHVAFVVFHGPVTYDSYKTAYGQWLARLLSQIDGPILLMGDANRSVEDKSPRKEIRALGFRDMRDQAAIVNESAKEFPSRNWSLCDVWTDLNDVYDDRIVGGEIDLTSAKLSDHRRIECQVRIVAR